MNEDQIHSKKTEFVECLFKKLISMGVMLSEVQIDRICALSCDDLEIVVQEISTCDHAKATLEVIISAVNKHEKRVAQ